MWPEQQPFWCNGEMKKRKGRRAKAEAYLAERRSERLLNWGWICLPAVSSLVVRQERLRQERVSFAAKQETACNSFWRERNGDQNVHLTALYSMLCLLCAHVLSRRRDRLANCMIKWVSLCAMHCILELSGIIAKYCSVCKTRSHLKPHATSLSLLKPPLLETGGPFG